MGIVYYWDPVTGSRRIKRRYVWGTWGFVLGFASAAIVIALI